MREGNGDCYPPAVGSRMENSFLKLMSSYRTPPCYNIVDGYLDKVAGCVCFEVFPCFDSRNYPISAEIMFLLSFPEPS